ncbi:hypothetical protein L6R49_11550 [Myxococcota bacterium]|nr:hypothetical protein [Myxococcota bacterium]
MLHGAVVGLWWVSGAVLAEPLIVRVEDRGGRLSGEVNVELTADAPTSFVARDDGQPPDVKAGDAVFTALLDPAPPGERLSARLLVAGVWTAPAQARRPEGPGPELRLRLGTDGALSSGAEEAVGQPEGEAGPGSIWLWALAASGWGAAAALGARLARRGASAQPADPAGA